MIDNIQQQTEIRMQKSLKSLQDDLKSVRTGRASPALFDKIRIDYYGTPTPINQMATISVPESRLVVIQPWDKSTIAIIEKSIQNAQLSLNPTNDGKLIRIVIPPLSEERRQEYIKIARDMSERYRVAIRNIRRDANETIKAHKSSGDFSEDEEKIAIEKIQKLTDTFIERINSELSEREQKILEI